MNRLIPALLILLSLNTLTRTADDPVPHPNDPVLQSEHMDMLALVPESSATHIAVADGNWSEPATWKGKKLPEADAKVHIPRGKTVTVDKVSTTALRTVRVDGKLEFATDCDTCLIVDTLVIPPGGEMTIGTPKTPIATDKKAQLIFADPGPIDTNWDPNQLSRGLIAHG